MALSALAVAGITSGIKLIGGLIAKRSAKKKGRKAEAEIKAQTDAQAKELAGATADQQRAFMDTKRAYEGMTSISPETQYARKASERKASSNISRATRAGANSTEIMNQVAGITAAQQSDAERISAQEETRRRGATVASKGEAVKAAQAGLAGKQMQINLQDKAFQRTMQKQGQINQTTAQDYNFFSGALGDLASASMMDQMYGGGVDPVTGASLPGKGIGSGWGKRKSSGRSMSSVVGGSNFGAL